MDNVIKQGVLRKEPNQEKNKRLSGILAKFESPKWCVLVIRDGVPYFEIYVREEDMFTGRACLVLNLSNCKQVSYTLSRTTKIFSFCIVLPDDVIQLVAATKQQMLSWVKSIETCLSKLGILESRDDAHVYTFCPAVVNRKGRAVDDEAEGAVGGEEEEDSDNPYHLSEEDINILDAEGENIFSTIHEVDVRDLHRKASVGDVDSQMMLGKLFHFDWMKEPESLPVIESGATSYVSPGDDDDTGSEHFVDKHFWEKNRISKVMTSELKDGASNVNESVDEDLDLDDGYCGLKELVQARATSRQNSNNFIQSPCAASASATNYFDQTNENRSPLERDDFTIPVRRKDKEEKSAKVCQEACNESPGPNQNIYAPFPEIPVDRSNHTSLIVSEKQVCPIPKPRKLSLPQSNSLSTNPVPDDTTKPANEINNTSIKTIDQSKPSHHIHHLLSKPTDKRNSDEGKMTDREMSSIPTKLQNGELDPDVLTDDSDDEEYTYEGIFDKKTFPALPVKLVPPSIPKRSDSLLPQATPPVNNSYVNHVAVCPPIPQATPPINTSYVNHEAECPPIPARTNHFDLPPSLPPRNKSYPGGAPPLPVRSKSVRSDLPPNIARQDVRVLERQLSNRMRVDRTNSIQTVISLKQNQMELLKEETRMPSISYKLESSYFQGLALVDVCDQVWIAGWNVKGYPKLHDKFHIGDQVLHINNVKVTSASVAMKTVKQSNLSVVDITIRRLPKAKVFVIRRSAEGESLGIKREKGTAEIVYVDPQGLAGKNDLHHKPLMMSGLGTCNWFITEINSRTLNLSFKDMEIEHRLGAVGKDISFVVQPSDFIMELKKQLKKMSGYKNFLLN